MSKIEFSKKKLILAFAMLPFLLLSAQAFGQSGSLSGTVTDASQAVLPGATITATNTETGIKTTITTNNAGVYNMALTPGTYEVTTEMPGFQTITRTDVEVGIAATLRLNFELEVSGVATEIEVSTSAADLLLESSSSTGLVMNEELVKDLPLLGNDIMSLINVMGGVVKAENTIFGNADQTLAGVRADAFNLTRDGISINDVRYSSGIVSVARLNPEMVGEFKLVLTPVDAEMGRGAGQVQVLTKSGGNEFHGSGVWSVINTAFDANEWDDNRTGNIPMWKNVNQYTISVNGPIVRNKTFFFVSWDHAIPRKREDYHAPVLTACARKGIFRYMKAGPDSWPGIAGLGWIPGDADDSVNTSFNQETRPSVNPDGTPKYTYQDPSGETTQMYEDVLHWGSVLGQLTPEAIDQIAADPVNCSQFNFGMGNTGVIPGTNWDYNSFPDQPGGYRTGYDQSGYIDRFSSIMPLPNYYYNEDGLNMADFAWTRTTRGEDTVYGSGMDSARKSIMFKIDHNINTEHRLSGTYTYEKSFSDGENEPEWPSYYGGYQDRHPQTFTVALTSTLRPTLLNEARFGLAYNFNQTGIATDNPATGEAAKEFMQEMYSTSDIPGWSGLPIAIFPGSGDFAFAGGGTGGSHFLGTRVGGGMGNTWGSQDYRWSFSDTVTWTKGAHSLKFGAEVRLNKGNSYWKGVITFGANGPTWYPRVTGGSTQGGFSPPSGLGANLEYWPGLRGRDAGDGSSGTYDRIYDLLNYMAGSVQVVRQYYWTTDTYRPGDSWNDPAQEDQRKRWGRMNQTEMSYFFKDDWKVTADLTLNLGVRYEYYGVPHMRNGLTLGIVGGADNIFGGQAGGFDGWLRTGSGPYGTQPFDSDNLTEFQFIGPGSANSDIRLFNKDLNNWGPAVGFAWQLPWFGRGKTTLRGGYQLSYINISRMEGGANFMGIGNVSQPSLQYLHEYGGDSEDYPYMDLTMLPELVPTYVKWDELTPQPMATRLITDGSEAAYTFDPNVRNPYVQSLTLALTRQITSSLTLDVRYIGTLSRKQMGTVNLNTNNWMANGLKEALDIARAGGESELLDQMLPPYSLWFASSGAQQLRTYFMTSGPLAQGNYNEIASVLGTENGLAGAPPGVEGQLLRSSGFPENFIYTNRQFSSANYRTNLDHTNYHSMQVQFTMRPTHGLNFQASYTWSRNLGNAGVTDPLNRAADYRLNSMHRSHMLTSYGSYTLPLGPNGYLFRDSSGWVKKLAEGWQLSWISNLTSGVPDSVGTVASMWGGSAVDLVRPDLFDPKAGHVTWESGSRSGRYFGDMYVQVNDPQCSTLPTDDLDFFTPGVQSVQTNCQSGLKALALASDPSVIVFQKAQPGTRGNFDQMMLTGPGRWGFDLAVSKNIEFMEGKSLNFRVDVHNILNHATPTGSVMSYDQRNYFFSNPVFNLNSTDPFGYIGYKSDHRVFSAKLRLSF